MSNSLQGAFLEGVFVCTSCLAVETQISTSSNYVGLSENQPESRSASALRKSHHHQKTTTTTNKQQTKNKQTNKQTTQVN